jgi:hypothetical protein
LNLKFSFTTYLSERKGKDCVTVHPTVLVDFGARTLFFPPSAGCFTK